MAMNNEKNIAPAGTQLNWIRTGPAHADTVVLIHAVGYDLTYWDRQIEALQADYNVVAFDLPGHGSSPGGPQDCSFDKAAATVADLIEVVSSRPVHLVGISYGGMIAQATVLARPELVRSLTLIGTASTFPEAVRKGMRTRAEVIRAGGMYAVLQPSLERWFTPETRAQRPDIVDRVSKTMLADDPTVHAAIWEIIADFEVYSRLCEINCPTLVMVGERDPSTPPATASALAKSIKGASLVVLPSTSHMSTVEAPDAVNVELLQFLARN
jgi:3-oxoadipate enol-lactonase